MLETEEIIVGAIKVNLQIHRVYVNEIEVALKNKEYELLAFV